MINIRRHMPETRWFLCSKGVLTTAAQVHKRRHLLYKLKDGSAKVAANAPGLSPEVQYPAASLGNFGHTVPRVDITILRDWGVPCMQV